MAEVGVRLKVNGEEGDYAAATVSDLLETLKVEPRAVAVERNLVVVPKSLYPRTRLEAGDQIEIVQFVGGG